MQQAAQVVELLRANAGSNAKMMILAKNAEVPGLKEILRFIYNPYVKTGIASAKIKSILSMCVEPGDVSYRQAIDFFTINTTGGEAAQLFAAKFIKSNKDAHDLAVAIVTQDLKIGVTATTLNKVYGANFIPLIGCMLGTSIDDVKPSSIKWPCIVTNKEDGIRRLLIKRNGVTKLYSRAGHEDFGLVQIVADAEYLPDNTVYDGELVAEGNFVDCIAQRQATASIANSKGTKTGLQFRVFDSLPRDEYETGISVRTARVRKLFVGALLRCESIKHLEPELYHSLIQSIGVAQELNHIKHVPILGVVNSLEEAIELAEPIWAAGGEGVMLNTVDGKYEIKRTKSLIKIKKIMEFVLPVIDFEEGEGRNEGTLGALVVEYKGNRVGVGSGFSDALRNQIWTNKQQYKGMRVEVESFGESTNATGGVSINCPIFKRFKGADE